ncbi:hypothetical protein KCTC52924_01121 [Arenibacter antarcticus]|uniref:GIY-YIG domain-containing protein n=1 Tax=Arenibacter antarcticus TaxID=2040469 RepID=A0ABW5VBF6_9FLAO|nr:hypothetical protein [Arenibacter sp. H213]MCM4168053.1 hypothetical protein [Arenibacter sp. H213]
MDLKNLTNTFNDHISQIVELVTDESINHPFGFTFTFNTKNLEKYNKGVNEAYERESFVDLFEKLDGMKNHCLYWFEIEDKKQRDTLIGLLNTYRENKKEVGYRTVPAKALKNYEGSQSNVIYVGVRTGKGEYTKQKHSNIAGRINQHLGYYGTNATQGLQLCSYASGLDINITLKVFQFSNLGDDYLKLIEKAVARHFKPHCGRH